MIKVTLKLAIAFLLVISSTSFAGPIKCDDTPENCLNSDNISNEFFIAKDGFDWVWASFVNTQFSFGGLNELKAPSFNGRDWQFATTVSELEALFLLTVADFTRTDGTIIEATKYWNTQIHGVDISNLNDKNIASVWVDNSDDKFYYETFYVRSSITNVPEPSTLFILAIGLVGLAVRQRRLS